MSGLREHPLEAAVAKAAACFFSFAGSSWTEGRDGKENICVSAGDGWV